VAESAEHASKAAGGRFDKIRSGLQRKNHGYILSGSINLVREKPAVYAKKLGAINFVRRAIYKILFIDKHIWEQRANISKRNHEARASFQG
jgi:hypothetical protein